MRFGHTSVVNFLSNLAMSFSGFIATIVLTRTLGQEQYGTYVVVLSVLAWVAIVSDLGLSSAVKKRVSEADNGNYIVAGLTAQSFLYIIVASFLWLVRPYLNSYIGMDATLILIALLAVRLLGNFISAVLDGQHLVHVSSLLSPVEWASRSTVQVFLVLSGFGIAGAFAGYLVGAVVAIILGSYFTSIDATVPSRHDFNRLKSYAQFSWLASIKGRAFLSMDTLILAVFVANSTIGVYEIAWNLASLFAIFGSSIRRTLFPEMSSIASKTESRGAIAGLLQTSLAYAGLFIIPGLIGSAIVGDVILTIYGRGFTTGYYILLTLTFARLLAVYQGQFLNTVDAVDRPDLTFRINAIFVVLNVILNVLLIWQFGWYGAAVATTISAGVGLGLGYYYAKTIIEVSIPVGEIAKQLVAACIMGFIVYSGRLLFGESLATVIGLVVLGAAVYFSALLSLSTNFRNTVEDNTPINLSSFLFR